MTYPDFRAALKQLADAVDGWEMEPAPDDPLVVAMVHARKLLKADEVAELVDKLRGDAECVGSRRDLMLLTRKDMLRIAQLLESQPDVLPPPMNDRTTQSDPWGHGIDVKRLADRLDELADYVTQGADCVRRNFVMQVPAEPYHDADLVIGTAARLLRDWLVNPPSPAQLAAQPVSLAELSACHEFTRALLRPAYEPGDGSADGAQLVNQSWWHPSMGCDSLQIVVDNARNAIVCRSQP
jgi:hypothetical protein